MMRKFKIQNSKFKIQNFNLLIFALLLFTFPLFAQDEQDKLPPGVVEPPVKTLSKDEKNSLESQANNIKKRTKISLELMDMRVERAEKSNTAGDFKASLEELTGFHAILDNTLEYLLRTDSGKSDRSFISFEIYLRKQVPRLEAIRREMPFKYGYHVEKIMKAVREARAKAVEPLFSDKVVPENKKP